MWETKRAQFTGFGVVCLLGCLFPSRLVVQDVEGYQRPARGTAAWRIRARSNSISRAALTQAFGYEGPEASEEGSQI